MRLFGLSFLLYIYISTFTVMEVRLLHSRSLPNWHPRKEGEFIRKNWCSVRGTWRKGWLLHWYPIYVMNYYPLYGEINEISE